MLSQLNIDNGFEEVKERVAPDNKGRLSLGSLIVGKKFRVYKSSEGQILLDPVIDISQRELSSLADPEKLAAWQRAQKDLRQGNLEDIGSFSQYVD
jgi:hypothetical protein